VNEKTWPNKYTALQLLPVFQIQYVPYHLLSTQKEQNHQDMSLHYKFNKKIRQFKHLIIGLFLIIELPAYLTGALKVW
jgi:hypothetical protein